LDKAPDLETDLETSARPNTGPKMTLISTNNTQTGYGHGNGDGSGYGYGNGKGCSNGSGSGNGYGYGSGYSFSGGFAAGDGYGYGEGEGEGNRYGEGSGEGEANEEANEAISYGANPRPQETTMPKPGSDHELSEKIRQLEEKLAVMESENERLRVQLRKANTVIHAQHNLIMDYGD